jgi:hypothetical protein
MNLTDGARTPLFIATLGGKQLIPGYGELIVYSLNYGNLLEILYLTGL